MKHPDTEYNAGHGIFVCILGGVIGAIVVSIPGKQIENWIPGNFLEYQRIREIVIGGSALTMSLADLYYFRLRTKSKEERRDSLKSSLQILQERQKSR